MTRDTHLFLTISIHGIDLMAAYNYIVFDLPQCPVCDEPSVLRAQTHIASDFDGDADGRFMEQDYRLGERMRWFAPESVDFDTWVTWGFAADGTVREVCFGNCGVCQVELFVVLEFADVTPVAVREVGVAKDHKGAATKWKIL